MCRLHFRSLFTVLIPSLALTGVLVTAAPSLSESTHEGHGVSEPSQVVNQPAGPMLQEKMARAVEQIERQVQSKGLFQGAGAHAMQQGVLLVAEDQDKVKVLPGSLCPPFAPVRAFDVTVNFAERNDVDLRRAAFAIGIERVARASKMRGYV